MKFEDFGLHSLFLCGFTVKLRVHGFIVVVPGAPGMDAGHGRQAWTPGMDVWAQERKLTEMFPMDSGIWAQTSKFKFWTQ